jgi:gluconate 2-dehydrogenase gamma chain
MSETRRELLQSIGALTLTRLGVNAQTGSKPKRFTAAEYKTLQRLADLIIPADDHSPGALTAGAPEFIDFLASQSKELADIFTGGIAWLDHEMNRR